MTGPFALPWLTFAAILVIAGSIIGAIVWGVRSPGSDDVDREASDE
jgi:hypothetical protein